MNRFRTIVAGTCAAVAVMLSLALASSAGVAATAGQGGGSIASAPPLPIGRQVSSGWANQSGGEFWRVALRGGDRIVFNYAATAANCSSVAMRIYAPSVTDYTLGSTSAIASDSAYGKRQFIWVAPRTGRWIINFAPGCSTDAYTFTALVKRFVGLSTHGGDTIASAPPLPVGRQVSSGWANQSGGEFWRVALRGGDRIVFNYAATAANCSSVAMRIYAPSVTDYTLGSTSAIASDSAYGKRQFIWVAPRTGRWIINFAPGCSTDAYTFTAHRRRR